MTQFSELKEELSQYLSDEQIDIVHEAYLFAEKAHEPQKRSSGEPYITHPTTVALLLAKSRMDYQSIAAALLHDVLEDTEMPKEALAERFGEEVADLVDGVSKLTQINFETRAEAQAANFRKMMMAMAQDIRVILIKLADRLHNMRTLGHLPPAKRHRIAKETLDIYAPIANRLGMRVFRDEFYELGFQMLYPLRYNIIKNAVKKAYGNRKEIVTIIDGSLNSSLRESGITQYSLYGREKNFYSIYRKMREKHLKFSEVMDVYAYRIVVENADQCYRVLGAVHNSYKPVPERFKDYIAIPKANGYQSLHTTLFGPYGVPIEIQIRTEQMDKMAENGISAHWLYKSTDQVVNQAQLRAREWIKGVLEIQQSAGDSLEFIENVKIDLFPDEVYVFTPSGDIMELPNGATAVDFAYAVHSDIGNSCVAVKIDRRLVPLSTQLKSGQAIEVVTAPGASPNPAWLNFVVTGKSRSNIRHFLKKQQSNESIGLGQRLLDSALMKLDLSLDKISDEQKETIVKALALKTFDQLFEEIGLGNQMAPIIAQRLQHPDKEGADLEIHSEDGQEELVIKGTEGMAVTFANCCYPIPGDPVQGILTMGHGIVVHTENCLNTAEIRRKHPEKCIAIRWEEGVRGEFQVGIAIEMENRRGTLATLALALADAESNIDDVKITEHDGRYATINVLITLRGRVHLARILRRLRQISYISKIYRHKSYVFG